MGKLLIIFLTINVFLYVNAEQVRYDNYKLFSVRIANEEQLNGLRILQATNGVDFFKFPTKTNSNIDVLVSPEFSREFEAISNELDLITTIKVEDFQKVIDAEKPLKSAKAALEWTSYYELDVINEFLDSVIAEYPDIVTEFIAGHSFEGRDLRGIKISYQEGNPGILIDGNIHAREWISSATATWIINELLTSSNAEVRHVAENYDWYILPVINPDGFVYSHTTDRLWRKSRTEYVPGCYGADPNRNWDFMWNTIGADTNPCSITFAGTEPFSEIEMRTLSEYYTSIADKITIYTTLHSYSQLLLIPYGYTTEPVATFDDLYQIGMKTVERLEQRHGTRYVTGNAATILYYTSGTSRDWVKAMTSIPIVYTYELRDQGTYGFVLPPDQIIPNSEEVLDSLIAMIDETHNLGYF